MTEEEARTILKEASTKVEWYNLGIIIFNLGQLGMNWGRHTNDRWLPAYEKARRDNIWLKNNFERIIEAIDYLYINRVKKTSLTADR
jgi:hypothetical protein